MTKIINQFLKDQESSVSGLLLGIYRILFGTLMMFLVGRFFYYGWIEKYFITPKFFFTYYGLEWISPLPGNGMYFVFAIAGVSAFFITIGLFYRYSVLIFFLSFTYFHLCDITIYLNHYYLISLLSFLFLFIPADSRYSLTNQSYQVKKWHYDILKFQIGCVYFFGGIAKLKYDWLILGQPMKIWLVRNSDFPILGGFFTFPIAGYLFSYAGLIFDLTVAFLLLTKKRVFAYLALLFFHLMTAMLFPIGMFPWVMIASSILFLEVDYFENKFNFLKRNSLEPPKKENFKLYKICICMYIIIQIFLPLRHFLYPGNLNWTEEGFRFSWNIMVMQKNGDASFRILERETKKSLVVYPKDFLTENQVFMMSTQPDMILQFAHYLKRYFEEKSGKEISVFADVFVSLNGREAVRFIHPEVDLGKIHESFLPKKWILPAPP